MSETLTNTSSPGLAAALEQVAQESSEAEAAVEFGYAVGYIPGVLIVVLGMQLIPVIFKLDAGKENQAFCEDLDINPEEERFTEGKFRLLEFFIVIAAGYLLGTLGRVGLGSTGGILAAGLVLGYKGRIGPLDFRMPAAALATVRELGIVLFLSVVGLRYGYRAVASMASGFLFGRYILKLNWILLAGALCGAMTSTPGLGAAVEAGYGAVYPVALLSMVLFKNCFRSSPETGLSMAFSLSGSERRSILKNRVSGI